MKHVRYVIKTKKDIEQWISSQNAIIHSLCPHELALQQFNNLASSDRSKIKKRIEECDKIRRKRMTNDESWDAWRINIMVDAHIIAYEYNIDPLAVVLCVCPPCKPSEKIITK